MFTLSMSFEVSDAGSNGVIESSLGLFEGCLKGGVVCINVTWRCMLFLISNLSIAVLV